MKGINTKFTNLWDAKIEKNMRQRITQDNIYVVRQFAYVHGVVEISLFIRKNYKMQQYSFLFKNNTPNPNLPLKNHNNFILGRIIIWIKHN